MFTTVPGFSSRSSESHVTQFPMRDEAAAMEEREPGWSNSAPDSPAATPVGTSVSVEKPEEAEAETKVVEPEDKQVAKKAPAKKTAAKKG